MNKVTRGAVRNRSLPWATGFNPTGRPCTAILEPSHSKGKDVVFASTLSLKGSWLLLSKQQRLVMRQGPRKAAAELEKPTAPLGQ